MADPRPGDHATAAAALCARTHDEAAALHEIAEATCAHTTFAEVLTAAEEFASRCEDFGVTLGEYVEHLTGRRL